jgi:hypothetical protein
MSIAEVRNRQNFATYLAGLALVVALASFGRSPNPSANENNDSWKNERQYPPLVFTSNSWLDCSISSSANGRQIMTTTSGQGFTFDATMLPLQNGKLQLQGQTGMMYKFESFPTAAVKAHFTGLGDGMITEMKSEVEVSVARFKQPAGAGTAIISPPRISPPIRLTWSSPACSCEPAIANHFRFVCFSAASRMEAAWWFPPARRRILRF